MIIYSYKNKEITCYVLISSSRYMLILEVYSSMLARWGGWQSLWCTLGWMFPFYQSVSSSV